jgi:hypothetical protein
LLSGTELVILISPTENGTFNDASTFSGTKAALATGFGVAATTGSGVASTTGSGVATASGSAKSSSSFWGSFLFLFLANCLA